MEMSWKRIALTLGLVAAGLGALAMGQPALGSMLIGAAVGAQAPATVINGNKKKPDPREGWPLGK